MLNKTKLHVFTKNIVTFLLTFIIFSAMCFGMLYVMNLPLSDITEVDNTASNVPIKNDAYYNSQQQSICNVLLMISSDTSLDYIAIISVQPQNNRAVILPLPTVLELEYENEPVTASYLFEGNGQKALTNALTQTLGIGIQKYINCSADEFGKVINTYGALRLDIPDDVDFYYGDIPVRLAHGTQLLDGATASKLLYNTAYSDETEANEYFTKLLDGLFNNVFANKNIENSDKFKNAVNCVHTDISYIDYINLTGKLRTDTGYNTLSIVCPKLHTYYDSKRKRLKSDDEYTKMMLDYFYVKQ